MIGICGRMVNFWWVFVWECIIIVMCYIVVSVYNDFMVC